MSMSAKVKVEICMQNDKNQSNFHTVVKKQECFSRSRSMSAKVKDEIYMQTSK